MCHGAISDVIKYDDGVLIIYGFLHSDSVLRNNVKSKNNFIFYDKASRLLHPRLYYRKMDVIKKHS